MQKIEVLEPHDQEETSEKELEKLLNGRESDFLDFKAKWYERTEEMSFDILCISNSPAKEAKRYLVVGIEEDKDTKAKKVLDGYDITKDSNRKDAEKIIDTLRSYIFPIPGIHVRKCTIIINNNKATIDIITITQNIQDLPYYVTNRFKMADRHVQKHGIYSRDGECNTKTNELTHPSQIEKMFARKRGEHLNEMEKFYLYLDDAENWHDKYPLFSYRRNLDFKFKIVEGSEKRINFSNVGTDGITDYLELLHHVPLSEEIWQQKRDIINCTTNDFLYVLDVEIYIRNENMKAYKICMICLENVVVNGEFYGGVRFGVKLGFERHDVMGNKFSSSKEDMIKHIESTTEHKLSKVLLYGARSDENNYVYFLDVDFIFQDHDPGFKLLKLTDRKMFNCLNYEYLETPFFYAGCFDGCSNSSVDLLVKKGREGRLCNGHPASHDCKGINCPNHKTEN